jgi:uncharacterized protein YjbI with pentapeptide repeats
MDVDGYLCTMKIFVRLLQGFWKFLLYAGWLLLAFVGGWAMGYLRVPNVEPYDAFWVGFVACIAWLGAATATFVVWRRLPWLQGRIGRPATTSAAQPAPRGMATIGTLLLCLLLAASMVGAGWLYQQKTALTAQSQAQEREIAALKAAVEAAGNGQPMDLLRQVLDKVEAELQADPAGRLSPGTRARIVALSADFQPYRYLAADTLSDQKRSPGRGQLLLQLCNLPIDSGAWRQLLREANFSFADLRGADLQGKDLRGVQLKGADLRDANLRGADLVGADVSFADLWGARLDSARLAGANLKRAALAWAELNGADLRGARLDGADLRSAKFRGANLGGATVQWAHAEGALFQAADLSMADLLGTGLQQANLSQAKLVSANMMAVDLSDAHMAGADLHDLRCGKDLLDKLVEWRVAAAEAIRSAFRVVDDDPRKFISAAFRLEATAP